MAMAPEFAADGLDRATTDDTQPLVTTIAPPPARRRPGTTPWLVAAVFALVAVAEAAWIARAPAPRAPAAPVPPVPIVVDSLQEGDTVVVDGHDVGVTPLMLMVTNEVRSIRVRTRPAPDTAAEGTSGSAVAVDRPVNAAEAALVLAASSRDKRGGLRIVAPIELQVFEGERFLGSTADGPVVTTSGRHDLDFVNNALGYRSRQSVEIRGGQIVPMKISPPDGRVSVNAVPWAQVIINGTAVGETPLANLPLAIGEHEVTFRHPQLGEQTQKVIVKSNTLTRVSATFAR